MVGAALSMISVTKKLSRAIAFIIVMLMLYLNGSCSAGLIQPIQPSGQLIYSNSYITYTDAVTSDQRENIMYGANMWNYALHDGLKIEEIPPWEISDKTGLTINGRCQPVVLFDVIDSSVKLIKERDASEKVSTLGLTFTHTCSVTKIFLVQDRLKEEEDFIIIAAHEFGHALGLRHVTSERSIMHDSYSALENAGCVTREDARELCNHYECRVSKVRHCD